jgi:hypothetical protein
MIVVFRTDLHKMKIKHRIIGEYATKRCFFDLKKADHRYFLSFFLSSFRYGPPFFYVGALLRITAG